MKIEHLTVYFSDGEFFVDEDLPDNEDGTRNGGHFGVRFDTAEEAGEYVAQQLKEMMKK